MAHRAGNIDFIIPHPHNKKFLGGKGSLLSQGGRRQVKLPSPDNLQNLQKFRESPVVLYPDCYDNQINLAQFKDNCGQELDTNYMDMDMEMHYE